MLRSLGREEGPPPLPDRTDHTWPSISWRGGRDRYGVASGRLSCFPGRPRYFSNRTRPGIKTSRLTLLLHVISLSAELLTTPILRVLTHTPRSLALSGLESLHLPPRSPSFSDPSAAMPSPVWARIWLEWLIAALPMPCKLVTRVALLR